MEIYKIALTGGPCAGKTEVLKFISTRLKELGYNVITVPETAREFIENGIPPFGDNEYVIKFQNAILNRQLQKEKDAMSFSNNNETCIIICDRGIMDGQAYMDNKNDFNNLLNNYNLNELTALTQYDLVIDLISLASYKPELYMTDSARYEDHEIAKEKDYKVTMAWLLHPKLKLVYPTEKMSTKQDIVLNTIINEITSNKILPNNTNKYEIDLNNSDLSKYTVDNSKTINVTDNYLDIGILNVKYILRNTEYEGLHSYTLTICIEENDCLSPYVQRNISKKEFEQYLKWNTVYKTVKRKELKFVDNSQICKINFLNDKTILETENNNENNYIPSNIKIKEKKLVKK